MKIEVRPATEEDARFVGAHLRESDRQEVLALGLGPVEAVTVSFAGSDVCLAGCIDGVPALIFGLGLPLLGEAGEIWALGTPACGRAPVAMVKLGRVAIAEFLKVCPALENWCDARYDKTHRWLRLLGFTLGEPEPYGPKKALFRKLSIRKEE